MLLDDICGRDEILRVSKNELTRERAEIAPEPAAKALGPVIVMFRQCVQVLPNRMQDLLPVEPQVGMLSLKKLAETLRAAVGASPKNFERFRSGIKREQNSLADSPVPRLPFTMNDRQLVPSVTDIGHDSLQLSASVYHGARCCAILLIQTQQNLTANSHTSLEKYSCFDGLS